VIVVCLYILEYDFNSDWIKAEHFQSLKLNLVKEISVTAEVKHHEKWKNTFSHILFTQTQN